MKKTSFDQLLGLIPDLSKLELRVTGGALRDVVLHPAWSGEWRGDAGRRLGLDIRTQLGDEIAADSAHGQVTLKKPRLRTMQMTGEVAGVSVGIELRSPDPAPQDAALVFRCFVKAPAQLGFAIHFPDRVIDEQKHRIDTAYLPLVYDGQPLDVFYMADGPYLVLESRDQRFDLERFRKVVNSARTLLSYLTAQRFDGESCDVLSTGNPERAVEVRWHAGRDRKAHFYRPIPCEWGEWVAASDKFKLAKGVRALDAAVLSTCLATFVSKPALITPVEYLLAFPDAPLGMRGALLSVALESLTDHMENEKLLATVKPLEDEKWDPLRKGLERLLAAEGASWTPAQKGVLRQRLLNANSPTNRDKLMRPFTLLGVPVEKLELDAINERNTFLHEGTILDPKVLEDDPEGWRSAYLVEMRLFTAVNKLLLKYLGYVGPYIDWGAREFDPDSAASYGMLAHAQPAKPPA